MKTKVGGVDKSPIVAYYQFEEHDHPKVRVLQKGDSVIGRYDHRFTNENDDGFTFTSNLLMTAEGKVTIKGGVILNGALDKAGKGAIVEATYTGLGKKQQGKRRAYLFDVVVLTDDDIPSDLQDRLNAPAETESEDTDEAETVAPKAKTATKAKAKPAPVEEDTDEEESEEVPF